jgi:predicted transcriptional regulator
MPYLLRRGILVRQVGCGNPEIQARDKFHAFFMSKVKEVHIGNRIKAVLKEQGRTTVWLAKQIPCTPNHLYKVYANASINTDLLKRISEILDYNFFGEFIQNG